MTKRPLEKLLLPSKSSMTCETSVFRSAATSPLIFASVSHSTNWKPGGRSGMPPDAKLPSSHRLSITRHRSGYLTATTEWYVTGLTRELEGSMSPHAWESLTPAVWQFSSACISPAIGSRVSTCCNIHARRIRERLKLTVVPSRSCGSTIRGSWATSCGVAVRNCAGRPGSTELIALMSFASGCANWSVHTLPKTSFAYTCTVGGQMPNLCTNNVKTKLAQIVSTKHCAASMMLFVDAWAQLSPRYRKPVTQSKRCVRGPIQGQRHLASRSRQEPPKQPIMQHSNRRTQLFFRPTPDGSRQVVYQAGKTIAFCKFTELRQWQHQSWRQCAYKRELGELNLELLRSEVPLIRWQYDLAGPVFILSSTSISGSLHFRKDVRKLHGRHCWAKGHLREEHRRSRIRYSTVFPICRICGARQPTWIRDSVSGWARNINSTVQVFGATLGLAFCLECRLNGEHH